MTPFKTAGIVVLLFVNSPWAVAAGPASEPNPPEVRYEQTERFFSPGPRYPVKEREAGISGEATVLATVAVDGTVKAVTIDQSNPGANFGLAAASTAAMWKFNPATKTGQRAPFVVKIKFVFMTGTD